MSRKIQAPGIELNEYDRSGYDQTQDYSIVGTTSLIAGVADEGEDYTIQWVNSKQTLKSLYGIPTNEAEMYFYNAGVEILNKGGVCLMAKLPYDNEAKDKFNSVTYSIETESKTNNSYSWLQTLDPQLTSYVEINNTPTSTKIKLDKLDTLITGNKSTVINKIQIVDITRGKYQHSDETNAFVTHNSTSATSDFLGIVPVIVSPINALYFQNCTTPALSNVQIFNNDVVSSLSTVNHGSDIAFNSVGLLSALDQPLSTDYQILTDFEPVDSYSKVAASYFPQINYMNSNTLDTTYLKDIGIVVFKASASQANKTQVTLEVLESFVGSLDSSAKNSDTKATRFIDDIVNQNSKYIRVFSNVQAEVLKKTKTILINNQTAISLGFYQVDLEKKVSYENTLIKSLNVVLERAKDSNTMNIDLVVDAGTSTLAQLAASHMDTKSITFTDTNWKISDFDTVDSTRYLDFSDVPLKAWKNILKKYDDFCKYTRRDCVFLADGLRQLCINGNSKIVRNTVLNSSIKSDILPNLKYMTGLNSSYSAGYCNWFYISDDYSNWQFWCPPSIKAAGIYTYTDAYFHKWDAPAGVIRGRINSAIDCAFSPDNEEAGKIYTQAWNYAINYPIDGIVLEGQKTFQIKKTAFDRMNVRRLFLYLEKSVVRVAKYFLYQGNTAYLRQRFVDTIKPIFEDAVSGQGILEYVIRCDDTNNTAHTIDNNELHCQIAVKPVKTIEYIVLDFVCTNQSATVNETVFDGIK